MPLTVPLSDFSLCPERLTFHITVPDVHSWATIHSWAGALSPLHEAGAQAKGIQMLESPPKKTNN